MRSLTQQMFSSRKRLKLSLFLVITASAHGTRALQAAYPLALPPVVAQLDSGKRSNVFYVGEPIRFTVDKPATRYEVRDYRANIVDEGAAGPTLALKAQPPGWYKLYVFGSQDQGEPYGTAIGGTTFVVFRKTPGFPPLPSRDLPGGTNPSEDEPMRGVIGMGPQRLKADAGNPQASIKALEQNIALDQKYYLPYDPARKRVLLVAFSNGTKGKLDGVRQIVEHFKDVVTYWEPRNEPNGGSTGRDFALNEMKPFYETVKAVDPKLKVLGPGTVSLNPGMQNWLADFFDAGGGQYLDAFSFHIYNGINGDVFLGRKSLDTTTTLLQKYGLGNIEKWQTEQGYFAAVYGVYQPAHQARWQMLQMMLFEQYGIPKEHHHTWYDRSHGFWAVPAWWINNDGSLNPTGPLMRVWSEELYGTSFGRRLNFGSAANNLYLGSEFRGKGAAPKRVLAFISTGLTDGQVHLRVSSGATLRMVSAWGVARQLPVKKGLVTLPVPELPVYVEPTAKQQVEVVAANWGTNLARKAGVQIAASGTSSDGDVGKIADGQWENWYWAQKAGDQPWNLLGPTFPVSVDITLPKVQSVSRAVVYSATPWQYQASLLDFEVQYDADGVWKTLKRVTEPTRTWKVFTPPTRTTVDSFHSDRSVFQVTFPAVKTSKIRLLIHDATYGGGATQEVNLAGGQSWDRKIVMLREVELYTR